MPRHQSADATRPPWGHDQPGLIRPGLLPVQLDRLADFELQAGHHAAAERLAHRAADLRAGTAP